MAAAPTAPVVMVYRAVAPNGWKRALLAPLYAALRTLLPDQARPQRAMALADREYQLDASLPQGWTGSLTFAGDVLTVALIPPTTATGGGEPAA